MILHILDEGTSTVPDILHTLFISDMVDEMDDETLSCFKRDLGELLLDYDLVTDTPVIMTPSEKDIYDGLC
jgi:translation elongation factor EF-Tu-like GTPase